MIIDTHCHLEYYSDDEISQVLSRASNAGVSMINICIDINNFEKISERSSKYNIPCSFGQHPCNINELTGLYEIEKMKEIITTSSSNVVGIGETGLDYYRDVSSKKYQKQSFCRHIELSIDLDLPIIVHTREAELDTHDIISSYSGRPRGVIHCFTGSEDFMKKMLNLGFYISISGIITFQKSDQLRKLAKLIPMDRIIIETDSPYLAPSPYRGKKNEPSFVVEVAKCLSDIFNLEYEAVCKITSSNAKKLFSV